MRRCRGRIGHNKARSGAAAREASAQRLFSAHPTAKSAGTPFRPAAPSRGQVALWRSLSPEKGRFIALQGRKLAPRMQRVRASDAAGLIGNTFEGTRQCLKTRVYGSSAG